MIAILSDIHSNLEGLQAVQRDLASHGVKDVYCLGDVVGYGPNPRECLETAMDFKLTLLGNHDQAVLFDPPDFNPTAQRAAFWTREQIDAPIRSRQAADRRWEFLSALPLTHREGEVLYVHGSPANPLHEYIFPEDVYNHRKMDKIFHLVKRYCFQGHTHVPGIFTEDLQFYSPEEIGFIYELDSRKTLCNVGSVGQPRDCNPRASYVLFDGKTIQFRRIEYDFETTVRKIYGFPDLDRFLGDRLRSGR
ncbi:MAG TPA: metallophosphoesterase family protein [Gemmataceae bacterium]|nr:metallophosphoesterase family protein [Gemmataceae bacterium]